MMSETDLVLTRVLDAPRSLVWKVWSQAEHLARWWGPAGFGMKVSRLEFKVGGLFHYAMTPPGSEQAMWGKFQYDEIVPETRMVWRSAFSDSAGATLPNPWNAAWPLEIRNVFTLEDQGTKTLLTLRGSPFKATAEGQAVFAANLGNVSQGFAGTFAQLDAYLAEAMDADRSLVYRRTFEAPRAVVWKAWTSTSIAAWWGPRGFGNTIHAMDVKPGGLWDFTMHGPDGTDYPNRVVYREVVEPSRLAYDHGTPGQPDEFRVNVTFADRGSSTDMVYTMVFPTAEALRTVVEKYGASEGLKQNMDRFAAWLQKKGLLVTRVFDAPRAQVWKAFTDPAQLQRWWGPEHFTCPGARVDLRVGGRYLLGMRGPDGNEFWGTGEYREIVVNQKLVYTDNFSDAQGNVVSPSSLGLPGDWSADQLVTVTFAELGKGKTLLTVHQEHLPDEWKDMTVSGWSTSFDKLAKVLV
jgi:uncharacterized protein YndB with AHSA1/START domain